MIQRVLIPLLAIVMVAVAYQTAGWGGVALVVGTLVMWMLLYFHRAVQVMKRAANRPIGFVDSAVMLNAKLRPGVNLLHVMALTRSIGQLESEKDAQPEVYRWTDASASFVICEFQGGRLLRWKLERPPAEGEPTADAPAAAPGSGSTAP